MDNVRDSTDRTIISKLDIYCIYMIKSDSLSALLYIRPLWKQQDKQKLYRVKVNILSFWPNEYPGIETSRPFKSRHQLFDQSIKLSISSIIKSRCLNSSLTHVPRSFSFGDLMLGSSPYSLRAVPWLLTLVIA